MQRERRRIGIKNLVVFVVGFVLDKTFWVAWHKPWSPVYTHKLYSLPYAKRGKSIWDEFPVGKYMFRANAICSCIFATCFFYTRQKNWLNNKSSTGFHLSILDPLVRKQDKSAIWNKSGIKEGNGCKAQPLSMHLRLYCVLYNAVKQRSYLLIGRS